MCPLETLEPFFVSNYKSATDPIPAPLVEKQLREELSTFKIIRTESPSRFSHAIGGRLRPERGDIRITHDLGRPRGLSVNDATLFLKMKWDSFDSLAAFVTRHCYIARIDLKWYYRHFPVDPVDWEKLGFHWTSSSGEVWNLQDTYLNFGLRNAGEIACRFTEFVKSWARAHGVTNIVGIVDDFAVVHVDESTCNEQWLLVVNFLKSLGFIVSDGVDKTHGGKQSATFMGISVDTNTLQATLRKEKLLTFCHLLDKLASQDSWLVSDVRTLAGLTNWAARVVAMGRLFTHYILKLLNYVREMRRHHHVRPFIEARTEVGWWGAAMKSDTFHGVTHLFPMHPLPISYAETDARTPMTGIGCIGVFVDGGFVSLSYEQLCGLFVDVPPKNEVITVWEAYAVLVLLRLFPLAMERRHVIVRIDNPAAASGVQKERSSQVFVHEIITKIFLAAFDIGCRLSCRKVRGKSIPVADTLSRKNSADFNKELTIWKNYPSDSKMYFHI